MDDGNNSGNHQQNINEEEENLRELLSHLTQPTTSTTMFQSSSSTSRTSSTLQNKTWGSQEPINFSPESTVVNMNQHHPQSQSQSAKDPSDDGYNWKKYGKTTIKGSNQNLRSYYKCKHPNCPARKQVKNLSKGGEITNIVYTDEHNHPKPESTTGSSSSSSELPVPSSWTIEPSFASHGSKQMDSITTPETTGGDDEEDEPADAERWKKSGSENETISVPGSKTVKDQIVIRGVSETDKLEDRYRWLKYGTSPIKGNPNPRSYYKCKFPGCRVKKLIDRAPNDITLVITTYVGEHDHKVPVPAASGRGGPLPNKHVKRSGVGAAEMVSFWNSGAYEFTQTGRPTFESRAPFPMGVVVPWSVGGYGSEFGSSTSMGSRVGAATGMTSLRNSGAYDLTQTGRPTFESQTPFSMEIVVPESASGYGLESGSSTSTGSRVDVIAGDSAATTTTSLWNSGVDDLTQTGRPTSESRAPFAREVEAPKSASGYGFSEFESSTSMGSRVNESQPTPFSIEIEVPEGVDDYGFSEFESLMSMGSHVNETTSTNMSGTTTKEPDDDDEDFHDFLRSFFG